MSEQATNSEQAQHQAIPEHKEVPKVQLSEGFIAARSKQGSQGRLATHRGVEGAEFGILGKNAGILGGRSGGQISKATKNSCISSGFSLESKLKVVATLEEQDRKIHQGMMKCRDWNQVLRLHFPKAIEKSEKENCKQNAKNWFAQREKLKLAVCLGAGKSQTLHPGKNCRFSVFEPDIMKALAKEQKERGGLSFHHICQIFVQILEKGGMYPILVHFDNSFKELSQEEQELFMATSRTIRVSEKETDAALSGSLIKRMLERNGWTRRGRHYHSLYNIDEALRKLASRLVAVWAFKQALDIPDSRVINTDQCLKQRLMTESARWMPATNVSSKATVRQSEAESFTIVTTTAADGTVRPFQVVLKRTYQGEMPRLLKNDLAACGINVQTETEILVTRSSNGWQKEENLEEMLSSVFAKTEPQILILDNCEMFQNQDFISNLLNNNVFAFFGPSQFTGLWQPNDLFLHGWLRNHLASCGDVWSRSAEGQQTTKHGNLRAPSVARCAGFVKAIHTSASRSDNVRVAIATSFLWGGWTLPNDGSSDAHFMAHIKGGGGQTPLAIRVNSDMEGPMFEAAAAEILAATKIPGPKPRSLSDMIHCLKVDGYEKFVDEFSTKVSPIQSHDSYLADCRKAANLLQAKLEKLPTNRKKFNFLQGWLGLHSQLGAPELVASLQKGEVPAVPEKKRGAGVQEFYTVLAVDNADKLEKLSQKLKAEPRLPEHPKILDAFKRQEIRNNNSAVQAEIQDLPRAPVVSTHELPQCPKRKRSETATEEKEELPASKKPSHSVDELKTELATQTKKVEDLEQQLKEQKRLLAQRTNDLEKKSKDLATKTVSLKVMQIMGASTQSHFRDGYWLSESDIKYIIVLSRSRGSYKFCGMNGYDAIELPDCARWFWIVNTSKSQSGGSHWVLLVGHNETVQLIDPKSTPLVPNEMLKALKKVVETTPVRKSRDEVGKRRFMGLLGAGVQQDSWRCGYICAWWGILLSNMTESDLAYSRLPSETWYTAPPQDWSERVLAHLNMRREAQRYALI